MRQRYKSWTILFPLVLPVFFHLLYTAPLTAIPTQQQTVLNSTPIYYRLSSIEPCGLNDPISLGEYIKRSLPFEWVDSWGNVQNGEEALKAGAIAIRSWALSPRNAQVYTISGQNYFCIDAYSPKINFNVNLSLTEINNLYPNSVAAVDATDGIIMSHSNVTPILGVTAIDAQFRDDTGTYTNEGSDPWLKSIYDPISTGTSKTGMGQRGTKRWAWGENDSGEHFPKWDYRQILAHYYTGVDFTGVTPTLPNDRFNILQVYGLDPQQGISLERGEVSSGYSVLVQNTGQTIWDVNAWDDVTRECIPPNGSEQDYETLLAHHVYYQEGSQACPNCIGLMWEPFCRDDTYGYNPVNPGEHFWVYGYKFFMPDQDSITQGTTYNLRFDILRQANVGQMQWTGYPDFEWPGQDIPVLVSTPPPPNLPEVNVDKPPAVVSSADLENGKLAFSWSGVNATTFDLDYKIKDITEQTFPTGYNTVLSNSTDQSYAAAVNCDTDRRDWLFRLRGRKNGQAGEWTEFGSRTQIFPFAWPTSSALTVTIPSDSNTVWSNPVGMTNMGGGYLFWNAGSNRNWLSVTAHVEGPGPGETVPLGLTVSRPGGIGDYQGNITVNITNQNDVCGQRNFVIPVKVQVRELAYKSYLPVVLKNSNP